MHLKVSEVLTSPCCDFFLFGPIQEWNLRNKIGVDQFLESVFFVLGHIDPFLFFDKLLLSNYQHYIVK